MSTLFRSALFLLLTAFAVSASAQATRTWVSGVGDDANPCSRTAPCKTFAGAISKTAAGGVINTLDPGGFGAVTITKSITIEADGGVAGILVSGTNGVVINAAATDNVVLRNLKFDGIGTGLSGIRLLSAGSLTVDHCVINDFVDFAIDIAPTVSASKVFVLNSVLRRAGNLSTEALIRVQPTSPASVYLLVDGSNLIASKSGLRMKGPAKFDLRNSVINGGDFNGVVLIESTDVITGAIENVHIVDFPGSGLSVAGTNSSVRVGNSTISQNGSGLVTTNLGQIISLTGNRITGNGLNGGFTVTEATQ
ncbi:hypothetical protein C7S18_21780 [Ahniella affigens]|uniref:Right handed beta helix domain-containing protein n=1 Tax=Ahniella affigens TaxID=2021234 RepID=A0A2P1PXT3_9GAMM|nr:right-handed parallel beta-helix repeat-containing protein [Ahniella affigens]AVP99642.1 hypothetical protein C7S18_21780 [Ahniella affigens]